MFYPSNSWIRFIFSYKNHFIDLTAIEIGWGKLIWEGEGINEVGKRINGDIVIRIDKRYFRPTEVNSLLGDASKAKSKLGWEPKITLEELVSEMIKEDLQEAKKEKFLRNQFENK